LPAKSELHINPGFELVRLSHWYLEEGWKPSNWIKRRFGRLGKLEECIEAINSLLPSLRR
jgi:hypothetical protein